MVLNKHWMLILCFPFLMWSCSDDEGSSKPKPGNAIDYAEQESLGFITVLGESGQPLAGAKILIGSGLNEPFAGNFLTTDAKGQIMRPNAWTSAQAITVQAGGHVRVTHFGRSPGGATFRLRAQSKVPTLEISGITTGHTVRDGDGQVDFGLVMSALTRNDILAFDLTKVISNRFDTLSIMGQRLDIPSNIALPRQRENYILPIRLEKPVYRLSFAEQKVERVFAAQGRFPLKAVVDELRRGTPFHELINQFSLIGGVVRDIQIRNGGRIDLPVNETTFSTRRELRAPALGAQEVMVSLSVADLNGWLVPTDVKRLSSNETRALGVMNGATNLALGVLKNVSEFEGPSVDRVSATILPFTNGLRPDFLPLIRDPEVISDSEIRFDRPGQAPSQVNQLGTVAIYSEVKEIPIGNGSSLPHLARLWEVYAPAWVDRMNLPVWPEGTPKPLKKRWEVAYIGSQTKQTAELGQNLIDAATHVTHSSKDF